MQLSTLLEKVTVRKMLQTLYGQMVVTHDVEVSDIACDSRLVRRGGMFVAVRGAAADGHRFAVSAIEAGAKALVVEDDSAAPDSLCMHTGTVKIVCPDTREALARIAANWNGRPADRLTLVGVTGTNGKTTTASLVHAMLSGRGAPAGLIGTIEHRIGARTAAAGHTTPGPIELHRLLAEMAAAGCRSAVMEVSSHALDQRRTGGLRFRAAVFTNLSADHLDYHPDMESYFRAKETLFTALEGDAWAVINADDDWGARLLRSSAGRVLAFGESVGAELRASDVDLSPRGASFTMTFGGESARVSMPLVGRFNVSNALAAAGAGIALGMPFGEVAAAAAAFRPVRGRFEPVASPAGWTAIVDYAHTPDALDKTLRAVREAFRQEGSGRILVVFGCGGNRDRLKRPEMGRIAATLADVAIVTSDNPRDEDPGAIVAEVAAGAPPGRDVRIEPDRAAAIRMAAGLARPGDVVVVAGKGHEEYQVVGRERIPFSDRRVVEDAIRGTG